MVEFKTRKKDKQVFPIKEGKTYKQNYEPKKTENYLGFKPRKTIADYPKDVKKVEKLIDNGNEQLKGTNVKVVTNVSKSGKNASIAFAEPITSYSKDGTPHIEKYASLHIDFIKFIDNGKLNPNYEQEYKSKLKQIKEEYGTKIKPSELKMIPHWFYEKTQKNEAIDPKGMGMETADKVVARSTNRKQIENAQKRVKIEMNQPYLYHQTYRYYKSLDDELSSYLSKNDSTLDMYRGR